MTFFRIFCQQNRENMMHLYLPTQQRNDPRSEVLHTKYSHKIARNQSPKVINILIINKFKKITICSKTTQEKSLRLPNKVFIVNYCSADAVTSHKMKHSTLQEPNVSLPFLMGGKQMKWSTQRELTARKTCSDGRLSSTYMAFHVYQEHWDSF